MKNSKPNIDDYLKFMNTQNKTTNEPTINYIKSNTLPNRNLNDSAESNNNLRDSDDFWNDVKDSKHLKNEEAKIQKYPSKEISTTSRVDTAPNSYIFKPAVKSNKYNRSISIDSKITPLTVNTPNKKVKPATKCSIDLSNTGNSKKPVSSAYVNKDWISNIYNKEKEKEKRLKQLRQQVEKEQKEKELGSCTFKPKLNRKSTKQVTNNIFERHKEWSNKKIEK